MRFKQFLEAQVKPYDFEHQTDDKIIETLRKHCMKAMRSAQAGDFIYRGTRSDLKSGVYHPGTGERQSQNTTNFYTIFLDSNEANAAFPKRSKSFIGSTYRQKAHDYSRNGSKSGTLFYLFPFDETEIGFINDDDMWDLQLHFNDDFPMAINIVDMNSFWDDIVELDGTPPEKIKSMEDMQRLLRRLPVDKVVNALRRESLLHGIDRTKVSDAQIVEKFIDVFPKAYNYKRLGCTVGHADDLPPRSEIWFSGKCVAVDVNDIDPIMDEFGL